MRVVIGGSDQELKSCPCCGSDDLFIGQSAFLHYAIQCYSCGLKMEKTIRNKKSKRTVAQVYLQCAARVISAWNTRSCPKIDKLLKKPSR
jgi:uncharacterized protein (DUF983 family)